MVRELKVFITAGEMSGDALGARLMAAIKKKTGGAVRFSGVGGQGMQAEGLQSIFPMNDLSVMGVFEVLPQLKTILGCIRQTADAIIAAQPDVVITIDAPDFSFRVAKKIKGKISGKMAHYVAPTVWAWREGRAEKVAKLYDGIICLLPFEPPYFERHGMKAAFAGHSVLESAYGKGNGAIFRKQQNIHDGAKVLGVLFGSRGGELRRMGPVLKQAAFDFVRHHPDVELVAPTLPHLAPKVAEFLHDMPCNVHIPVEPDLKPDAFAAMDAALACSGTVGLELAVAGVPHVIGYRINSVTHAMVRRFIKADYAHLVNLLLGHMVIPEFIQRDCTPQALTQALEAVWQNPDAQRNEFSRLRLLLYGDGKDTPSMQAADFVLAL